MKLKRFAAVLANLMLICCISVAFEADHVAAKTYEGVYCQEQNARLGQTSRSGDVVVDDTTIVQRPSASKNVLGTDGTYYATLAKAVADAQAGGTLKLCADLTENVTISKNLCIDLNGYDVSGTVTVANGCILYGFDSQTDDYTVNDEEGYGKITKVVGNVQGLPEESAAAADSYLMVAEAEGVSFHRVNLQLTAMTLRASRVGVYYKSAFAGDELVAQKVAQFGVALSVSGAPTEKNPGVMSWFNGFQPGINGCDTNSTLLHSIMKSNRPAKVNAANAAMPIYGRAYILTNDGQYLFGATVSRTLQEQVEAIDTMWSKLNAQQRAEVATMYQTYSNVMQNWALPNLKTLISD